MPLRMMGVPMFSTLLKIAASPIIACEKIVQALEGDADEKSGVAEACEDIAGPVDDALIGTLKDVFGGRRR